MKHLILSLVTIAITNFAIAQNTDLDKSYFVTAKQQLENMLNGKEKPNYEKAIFLMENAWYENQIDKESFDMAIDSKISTIKQLIKANYDDKVFKKDINSLYRRPNAEELYNKALTNWAIYTYITTKPYTYSFADPMATEDWRNSQVVNLNNIGQGNCFALASLFKILSDRLHSDATLCTAPSHIYISHEDEKGISYNIELGSRKFPGTGTLATLTHSTMEYIRSDISLRRLTEKQSVALCLVYLAKGYEHKFGIYSDEFIMNCASTTLKYDSLNLNAMLLKAELLEKGLMINSKSITQLKSNSKFIEYEKLLAHVYQLGYREIPLEMKNQLIKGWSGDTVKSLADENYKAAETNASQLLQSHKASLSWGLFDEEFTYKPIERYGNTLFDCKTKRIKQFTKEQSLYNKYNFDPVVFAWNIDPLFKEYPSISPYTFCANNPILFKDPDGQKLTIYYRDENGKIKQYNYGTKMKVPDNKFVGNVVETLNTMRNDKDLNKSINLIVSNKSKTLKVVESSSETEQFYISDAKNKRTGNEIGPEGAAINDIVINSGTIYYNPYQGLKFNLNGDIMSPATQFAHEYGHGVESLLHTKDYLVRASSPNGRYDNNEEEFAILNYEHKLASYLCETMRGYHGGTGIPTEGPTSNTPMASSNSELGHGEGIDLTK